jgi:hypothetical protein
VAKAAHANIDGRTTMDEQVLGVMIPLSAVILGIGAGIFAIWAAHRYKTQKLEFRHRERMAAMERGLDVPPEAPDPELDPAYRRSRALHRGLLWSLVGIAVGLVLYHVGDEDVAWIGTIPFAVGLGNLAFYALEGRRSASRVGAG